MAGEEGWDLSTTGGLLRRARDGDQEARDQLVRRYAAALQTLLHGRIPASSRGLLQTQDLAQEVWLKVLRSLAAVEYRGVGSFWRFLREVALNHVRDLYRKPQKPWEELAVESSVAPSDPGPNAVSRMIRREQLEVFEAALGRLPARKQEAVLLRLELDQSYDLIAQECGLPSADAARMTVKRALREIYDEMSRHGA